MRLARSKALAGLAVLALAAERVWRQQRQQQRAAGTSATAGKVDIYSSLPLRGPSAAEAIPLQNGIRLALARPATRRARSPSCTRRSTTRPATAAGTPLRPRRTRTRPRRTRAVYYIGEFDDGASEVSMPILNQAGIAQVSPANTYVGLTTYRWTSAPGAPADEPSRRRRLGRASAIRRPAPARTCGSCRSTRSRPRPTCWRCTRRAAPSCARQDDEAYGTGMAKLIELQKGYYGIDIVSDTGFDPAAPSFSHRGRRA